MSQRFSPLAWRDWVSAVIFFSMCLGLCLGVAFMNIPPALDILMAHYRLDYLSISTLITALLWTHAIFLLPGGMASDRWGIKPTLGLGLFFLALGNAVPFAFTDICLVTAGRLLCGVGTGLAYAAAMKLLAMNAPPGRAGVYQAYLGGAVALGSIVAYVVLPDLAALDWRWPFGLPAGLSCLLLALLWPLAAGQTGGVGKTPGASGLRAILAIRQGWILGLLHALSWGSVLTLGNWAPSLLAEATGARSTGSLAWSGAAVMLVSGVGRIAGAPMLAKCKPSLVAGVSMFLLALVYAGIMFDPGLGPLTSLILAGVVLASVNFGSIFQLASRATGNGNLGGLLGFVNLLANLGAIFLTMLLGWFKDQTGSFTSSFLFPALACFSAGLLTYFFYRSDR